MKPDGILSFENSLVNPKSGSIDQISTNAKCDGAQCHVKFFLTYTGDYRVISTDYTNYAIVYTCNSHIFYKDEFVWILSRTQTFPSVDLTSIESTFTSESGYSLTDLYLTKQGGTCIYPA